MKILAWGAVVMGSVVALAACGGGGGTGGSGGGAGGGTTTGSTTNSGSTTGSTTTHSGSTTSGTTVTSGSTSVTTSSNPGGCGSLQYVTDAACQGCVEASCCAELKACDTGTDCGGILDCANACASGDQACISACTQGGQAPGFSDVQALVNCFDNSCAMDPLCTSPGAICDSGLQVQDPACGMCLGTNCCQEFTDCVADPGTPGGETCLDCVTGNATDPTKCPMNPLYAAVSSCQSTKCGTECAAAGGICDSGLTTNDAACDACLGSKCCTQVDACANDASNPSCLDACILSGMNKDPDCKDATTPLGMLYQPIVTCWNTQCSGANDCNSMTQ